MPHEHPYKSLDQTIPQPESRPSQQDGLQSSSAVQELISANPGYLVRHGTLIILIILCLILAGMYFIRYPDMLQGTAILTTDPMPIRLKSSSGGRILRLFVVENAQVKEGSPIAELENNTGYDNAQSLSLIADSILAALERKDIAALTSLSHKEFKSLGEGQSIYNSLVDAISAYALVQSQHIYAKRSASINAQTARYQSMSSIADKEKAMISEELRQADERFKANEKLYNDKVISRQEYYEESARQRQKKIALEQQSRSVLQNGISIAENGKQKLDIEYEQTEKENNQLGSIREQARNLQNFVQSWKLKYMIYAPYDGKMHYLRPFQVNETVNTGEEIGAVVPNQFHYTAFANMPAAGSGKIKTGQEAHLLLDQFPYDEYGYLQGKVSSISALPQRTDNNTAAGAQVNLIYRVEITLPDSLVTSHHRKIAFSPEMGATARVITRKRNLLQRLLSGFAGLDK